MSRKNDQISKVNLNKIKMGLFKKKCAYCEAKIGKGKEVFEKVKVPEFVYPKIKAFCNEEHAELYKKKVREAPKVNSCPMCKR